MNESGALTWREVVDKYHSGLIDELSVRLDSDLRDAVSGAVAAALTQAKAQAALELKQASDEARQAQIESLNQVLRRLRTTGQERILDLVAEGCTAYARQLVVLVFESNQARSINGGLSFDTSSAPAIVAAVESLDPVVALSTEGEISPALAAAFDSAPGEKAYLFPIVARHSVIAMLVASGVTASAPVELLCEAAGMRFEASTPPEASTQKDTGSAKPQPRAWDDLDVEVQRLHVQAQRMARLRVAEMRLYHENEVKSGTAAGDIYGALRNEIDAARDQFLQTFLSKSSTMVDYLHLEILRSLAHDDDRLLGHHYPGPMV
jgi:multidrug efflux pump subunit AcrA (membrane-fusion protein)